MLDLVQKSLSLLIMIIGRYVLIGLALALLPSCGLINSALRIPGSLLQSVGRTVGVSSLTDVPAEPVTDAEEQSGIDGGSDSAEE